MKTTPLPSVIEVFQNNVPDWRKTEINYPLHTHLLTQDRNQAYTSLVEGIEGMRKEFVPAKNIQIGGMESDVWKLVPKEDGMYCLNCERFIHEEGCTCGMASLTDILENVVKPLYGKK